MTYHTISYEQAFNKNDMFITWKSREIARETEFFLPLKAVFCTSKGHLWEDKRRSLRLPMGIFCFSPSQQCHFHLRFHRRRNLFWEKPFVNFSSCKRRLMLNKKKNSFYNGNNKSTGNKVNSRNHKQLKCQASTHQTLYAPTGKRR